MEEIRETFYYEHSKFPNVFYAINIALEQFLGRELFKGDLSRVQYASEEYAFRQRLNLLAQAGSPSIKALDLPFLSYYRNGSWEIDDRPGVQAAVTAVEGIREESLGYQKLYFLNMKTSYKFVAFFSSDKDAQLAYEILSWIRYPSAKQFKFSGVYYKEYELDIPIQFWTKNISFSPNFNETEWLQKNRIFPITFEVEVKSAILAHQPQVSSSIFPIDEELYITKKVLLDFLAYKGSKDFMSEDHLDFEVDYVFNPDPELYGTLTLGSSTLTSITVNWDYNELCEELYTDNVKIVVNNFVEFDVPKSDKTYTITELVPNSTYNISIWFTSLDGKVTKYSLATQTSQDEPLYLKGMVGYTF